jgi:two-component system chemotaxis response regulator CheY
MIVDDSHIIRLVHAKMMQRLGFRVTQMTNGPEALTACEQDMPDVVMVDWNMPEMDGLDFIIALRRLPQGSKPKILLCTIENNPALIQQALSAGADQYIMKPFDRDILISELAAIGLCVSAE